MVFRRYEGLDALRVIASFGIVFLHVYVAAGYPNSLDLFLKCRDFALPLMVLSSFFLLTLSLMRKPEPGFASFFSRRLRRLWLPLIVWSFVYSLTEAFVIPVLFGFEPAGKMPSAVVFFTGYRHLWFLQFIFFGSLAVYPFIYWLDGTRKFSRTKLSLFCFCLTFLYGFLFYTFLKNYTDWDTFSPETDGNLKLFVSQAGNYILYIPVAVGIGLMSGKINDLFARAAFRRLSLAAVLIAAAIHIGSNNVPLTREIYGITMFLAALQPWRKIPSGTLRALATYSYGIYILHFILAQILWMFVAYKNFQPGGAAVFGIAIIIYFISFAAAVLIRKLFPADWLLPLVPVSREVGRQIPANEISFSSGAGRRRFAVPGSSFLKTRIALGGNTDEG
ncbi:MAG: acyltransferase [Pyrinomonadaceae bacterium]|nr:acyltransferase [Pyrinomonadaceae bacterium]